MENEIEYSYFQFLKSQNFPIFVRVPISDFDGELSNFLKTMNFSEVKNEELVEAEKILNTNINARLLTFQIAAGPVARQIDEVSESDRYGMESITPKPGYRVYRFKEVALMVYSFNATEWKLGCYSSFGSDLKALESRVVINRFLAWSLAPLGVVGFWGVPVEEGMAVMRRDESFGEAVYFNVTKNYIITMNGKKDMKGRFKILRLDGSTKRKTRMKPEEFVSFLSNSTTFIDNDGLTVPIRQSIQEVSKMTEGVVHPTESFTPRTDLSL